MEATPPDNPEQPTLFPEYQADRLITVQAAADLLRVTPYSVKRYFRTGKLMAVDHAVVRTVTYSTVEPHARLGQVEQLKAMQDAKDQRRAEKELRAAERAQRRANGYTRRRKAA